MARTKKSDKASVKNGRATKGVVYNANHNTLEATRLQQAHIDNERMKLNVYVMFTPEGRSKTVYGGHGGFDAKAHEMELYKKFYQEGLDAKNQRYIDSRHSEDCRTLEDLYSNPKTAPLETIFQVGSTKSEIEKDTRRNVLTKAWKETFNEFRKKYGENFVPADMALHRDEAQDHIHCRVLLMAKDKFGNMVPNQTKALKAMGFERPDPSAPQSRYNNALISFTDTLRETFYRNCERYGIQIDREVENFSKRQVGMLEYKSEKLREEVQDLRQQESIHRQGAVEAAQRLREAQTSVKSLDKQIEALRAENGVLRQEKESLSAENDSLKHENMELRLEIDNLNKQAKKIEEDLVALRQQKEQAEAEQAQAQQDRDAAVAALKQIEKIQKDLYSLYNHKTIKVYDTLPEVKEKKNFRGKVTQEAAPKRVVVSEAELETLKEQAKYTVMVDYNSATISELDKKISENEIIKGLQAELKQKNMEIVRLNQVNERQSIDIAQHESFLADKDLTQAFENDIQNNINQVRHRHRY